MDSDMYFNVGSGGAFKKAVPGYAVKQEMRQCSSTIWAPSYSSQ